MRNPASRQRQRGQVLIVLFLGALLFGASAAGLGTVFNKETVKHLRKELKTIVADTERRSALNDVLDRLGVESDRVISGHRRQMKELLDLMENHASTPAQIDHVVAEADSLNKESRQRLLDLRFALRDKMSIEEWTALFTPSLSDNH